MQPCVVERVRLMHGHFIQTSGDPIMMSHSHHYYTEPQLKVHYELVQLERNYAQVFELTGIWNYQDWCQI